MNELTLESLAKRVEELERIVADRHGGRSSSPVPRRSDWAEVMQAVEALRDSDYDWDAWREQREYDLKHAGEHLQ